MDAQDSREVIEQLLGQGVLTSRTGSDDIFGLFSLNEDVKVVKTVICRFVPGKIAQIVIFHDNDSAVVVNIGEYTMEIIVSKEAYTELTTVEDLGYTSVPITNPMEVLYLTLRLLKARGINAISFE
ncbi:hypothetical protein HGA91_05580 [candidate division WWE3 bacterium]|nr:hypothetical protein [candidate division WWE3 bacterium]